MFFNIMPENFSEVIISWYFANRSYHQPAVLRQNVTTKPLDQALFQLP